jgi:hypothetical protein
VITESSSLVDVAFAVCTALDRTGWKVVLTGGSAATFYAPEAYESRDIDFVITFQGQRGDETLLDLGYRKVGDYYEHERAPFPIEFPAGPLMIGDELITRWNTSRRDEEILHILSPTDSTRDRLAAFLHWNDFSALEQALAVCTAQRPEIDLDLIRAWCVHEGQLDKYELFRSRLDG